jgi:cell division protein FtsW
MNGDVAAAAQPAGPDGTGAEAHGEVGEASAPASAVWRPDPLLALALTVLLSLGIVLVYSSSAVYAARTFQDPQRFLKAQLVWLGVGLGGMALGAYVPRQLLLARCGWLMLAVLAALGLVLLPGVGHYVGGARRWLAFGPVGLQPSEAAKLAVTILLASLFAQRRDTDLPGGEGQHLTVPVLVTQLPVILILCEPDLGTALVIEMIMGVMVFAAGLRLRALVLMVLTALPILYHLVVGTPFRLRRLLGYIDPWAFRSTVGYQVTEALISIGSGGLWGVGLGDGKQKLFFLPEAHTDFIFAILAEELGLAGVLVLLVALGVFIWRGLRLAMRAQAAFDGYLALGVTSLVGLPALFNVCVATGLLPTKGLPLPLLSYGGSNLVVTLVGIGLLWRIDRDVAVGARKGG